MKSRVLGVVFGASMAVAGVVTAIPAAAGPVPGPVQPEGLDHFKCYTISVERASEHATDVLLADQFGESRATVARRPNRLCNPVQKTLPSGAVTEIGNREAHLL